MSPMGLWERGWMRVGGPRPRPKDKSLLCLSSPLTKGIGQSAPYVPCQLQTLRTKEIKINARVPCTWTLSTELGWGSCPFRVAGEGRGWGDGEKWTPWDACVLRALRLLFFSAGFPKNSAGGQAFSFLPSLAAPLSLPDTGDLLIVGNLQVSGKQKEENGITPDLKPCGM